MFGVIVEIVALFFAAIQILLLSKQIKDAVKWNKLNSTFIAIDRFTRCLEHKDPELIEKIGLLRSDDTYNSEAVFEELIKNPNYAKDLYDIMCFYETFSINVLSGYINENIAKRILYINFTKAYKKLQAYVSLRTRMAGTDMFQHFRKLNDRWTNSGVNLPTDNYEEIKK